MGGSEDIDAAAPLVRGRGPWRQALARFRHRPLGIAAALLLLAFVVVAALTPAISPYPPGRLFFEYLNAPIGPSLHHGHLLGTDRIGHDYLAQLLYAIRDTMVDALGCALGATLLGVAIGAIAGYAGGALDAVITWLISVVVTVPAFVVLVLVVIYEAPVPTWAFSATLALYLWTSVARAVRGSFATLRTREFVEAAHAAGGSGRHVVLRHLLPNSFGTVLVAATGIVGQATVIIATVDYFSYGNEQSDRPSLGGLVANAAGGHFIAPSGWWMYAVPAVTFCLLLVCVNFVADTLDDVLDPGRV